MSLGILGQLTANNLLATMPAACWIAAWLALDPNTWGWVFQDGMGIALMVLVLRQFLLPNLKVTSLQSDPSRARNLGALCQGKQCAA